MNFQPEMTSVVLLGTGRGVPELRLPGEFNGLLEGASTELRLLRAAGILALSRGVTTPSIADEPTIEPAPVETAKAVTDPALVSLLGQIISDGKAAVIIEACHLLAKSSLLLPPRLLPRALAHGIRNPKLHDPLRSVLGKRGAWIAEQNAEWKFALGAGMEPLSRQWWDAGDVAQRAAYLGMLRNRDPEEARRLLEAGFAAETARDRAALLTALATGLSSVDEAFLAATLLNDRSKEVRQIAAALLSRLPESEFARRMVARLQPCVRSERKLLRTVITIEPPKEFSADWKTDTIEEKPPAHLKIGERGWWLQQMVSLTPLEWWEQQLKLRPTEILALAGKSDWKDALLGGLRAAITTAPRNNAWVVALIESGTTLTEEGSRLARDLSPGEADIVLRKLLEKSDDSPLAAQVIEAADFPWSDALWRVVNKKLTGWLQQQDWRFRAAIELLASRVPVSALQEEMQWPDIPLFAEAIAEFSRVIDQRRRLHQILK